MDTSIQAMTRQCGFIFAGTIRRLSAVTSVGIEPTAASAVVSVDRLLKGPDVLSGYVGREITLVLREEGSLPPNASTVFFTNAFHYGEGLGVREAGHVSGDVDGVQREVNEAMHQLDDDNLLRRLRSSNLVVSGTVIEVRAFEHQQRRGTEHDPDWWECIIEVAAVEKGELKSNRGKSAKHLLSAFFAHSTDVAWYQAPKLRVGDSGIFILHEGEVLGTRTPGPAIVHPLDFRPMAEAEHIRGLIRRTSE